MSLKTFALKAVSCAVLVIGAGSASALTIGTQTGANDYPFASLPVDINQYQQIYSSSLFSGAFTFDGISFQVDEGGGGYVDESTFEISFAVVASANFGSGFYSAPTTTFSSFGSGSLSAAPLAGGTYVTVSGGSFAYDPLAGDLVMNIDFHRTAAAAGTPAFFKMDSSNLDGLCATCSSSLGEGLVTTFNVTAVPEPETYAMLIAGLALVGGIARRRKVALH